MHTNRSSHLISIRVRWFPHRAISDRRATQQRKKIPLSGHPNNMAVGRVWPACLVGIIQEPAGFDVIHAASLQRIKTIPSLIFATGLEAGRKRRARRKGSGLGDAHA